MAHYEHLPIYREAMRLAVHLENVVRGFARYHKYTLGSEMRSGAHEIEGESVVRLDFRIFEKGNRSSCRSCCPFWTT
jgi:hypothetical protein